MKTKSIVLCLLATALLAVPGVAADATDDAPQEGEATDCEVYIETRLGTICVLPSLEDSAVATEAPA